LVACQAPNKFFVSGKATLENGVDQSDMELYHRHNAQQDNQNQKKSCVMARGGSFYVGVNAFKAGIFGKLCTMRRRNLNTEPTRR
jgi:hypothetical protein